MATETTMGTGCQENIGGAMAIGWSSEVACGKSVRGALADGRLACDIHLAAERERPQREEEYQRWRAQQVPRASIEGRDEMLGDSGNGVLGFARAYASLGTAVQEQLQYFFDVGPVDEEGFPSITVGAMAHIEEKLIRPFRDCPNEEIAEIINALIEGE